jgi:FKBP-type peptidyl-prolyl cis-trans isomerase FklB
MRRTTIRYNKRAYSVLSAFLFVPIAFAADAPNPVPSSSGAPAASGALAASGAPVMPNTAGEPADSLQAATYSLGLIFGSQLHHGGLKPGLPLDSLMQGIRDGLYGSSASQEDKQRVAFLLRSAKDSLGTKNKLAAQEFLKKNAKAQGVTTTASGLQYKVLAPGDAGSASPKPTDQVTVQYRGRLLNGTEFDSSYSHGQAASFRVNAVIKGWQEALPMMKPGAKWELYVPPELAYDNSTPAKIPPGSLLVFDIELVKINPPSTPNDVSVHQPKKAVTPKS